MSKRLYAEGTITFEIAASDKLAIFAVDGVKVYTRPLISDIPSAWSLLKNVAANEEYVSAAFSAASQVRLEAKFGEVLYAVGTAPVISERRGLRGQGAPGALDATGTLTAAMIASGIVTSTSALAVAATVDTGAVMDAALDMEIGESIDWAAIKIGANAFTVTAATGHTLVGSGAVGANASGAFRTRKTAASTFITYRLG